ncbi:MAG: HAMP domain-containing histidine kinase [Roseburia sp.]|nr:HAMP domain-containing histidine kinase [Roseburia sp.]
MYRNVRLNLTILFTLVISVLLAALLGASFYFSARQQFSMQLSSFTSQSYTLMESIDEQKVLTSHWLAAREEAAGIYIYLWDNNVPFFHNQEYSHRTQPSFSHYLPQLQEGRTLRNAAESSDISIGYHGLLPEIFSCHRQLVKNNSILQVYFLQSLDPLYRHIKHALLLYLALFIVSECLLVFFCWHFTGWLLQPLLDSQASQNRFIASVSHELRTPLAVILSNASACEKAPPAQQKAFFQVIAREGAQMSSMLEQLLTLSRADSHSLMLQIEKTDLQTLLLEIYEDFLPLAKESSHRLSIRLPETEIPLCECDSARIRQVCHILIHNALSYTPAGSKICIFLAGGACDKEIAIGIQDNGPGIPKEEREKIFDRFYRIGQGQTSADNHPSYQGKGHHGLGLAVAKEIAAAHKGSLCVKEAKGGGALFVLSLPFLR